MIQVTDDGPGLDRTDASEGWGIGLANTRARLRQLYGDAASLTVQDTAPGVTVRMALPRRADKLRSWLARLGEPLLVKLSINHHLIEHDRGLLALAAALREALTQLGGDREVVYNVRLRRGYADDDHAVSQAVVDADLGTRANVFFLQRYGMANAEAGWDVPYLAGHDFRLVNPDGTVFGPDLIARSAAMGRLP